MRLVLRPGGAIETSTAPFAPEPEGKIWLVSIAATRFDSRDPLLRHKTTRRDLYEKALAAARDADEVVFLNERDEVCEGARTNIFVERDGALLTPPVSCGLLPGVLRADLLAQGKAQEKVLRLYDLCGEFLLGNSLRGFLRARVMD
jgi:branched-subunit amino acid aminotransferase/4-amino-4-deoxychorismate lyase